MTELGQKLKEAREAKGITLNQLQEKTKIQKRYLAAIEEGNYGILPGEFYVKAFIKQYAEAVGVSKEELAALQSQTKPQAPAQEVKEEKEIKKEVKKEAKKEVKKEKVAKQENEVRKEIKEEKPVVMSRNQKTSSKISSSSRFTEYIPRILAIVAILGVLIAGWFILQNLNSNGSENQTTQQGTATSDAQSDQPKDSPLNSDNATNEDDGTADDETEGTNEEDTNEPEEDTTAQELTVTETSGNRSTMTLKNADSFIITLTATGETYVEVSNNAGKTYFAGTMQEGQTETFDLSADDVAEMNIGNTLGLDIKINNEELTYPINPSDRVHQRITIERISETE